MNAAHRRECSPDAARSPALHGWMVRLGLILLMAVANTAQATNFNGFRGGGIRSDSPSIDRPPNPAVARILVHAPSGDSYGSGTVVRVDGYRAMLLTNYHVVQDALGDPTARTYVILAGGKPMHAVVLAADKKWDIAAVAVWQADVRPIRIASSPPRTGETLSIAGFGGVNSPYREATGKCLQFVSPDIGPSAVKDWVQVSATARQGDSGGPILNQRGELVGVLWGADAGSTTGSHTRRVRQFLQTVEPKFAALGARGPDKAAGLVAQADTEKGFAPNVSTTSREAPRISLPSGPTFGAGSYSPSRPAPSELASSAAATSNSPPETEEATSEDDVPQTLGGRVGRWVAHFFEEDEEEQADPDATTATADATDVARSPAPTASSPSTYGSGSTYSASKPSYGGTSVAVAVDDETFDVSDVTPTAAKEGSDEKFGSSEMIAILFGAVMLLMLFRPMFSK